MIPFRAHPKLIPPFPNGAISAYTGSMSKFETMSKRFFPLEIYLGRTVRKKWRRGLAGEVRKSTWWNSYFLVITELWVLNSCILPSVPLSGEKFADKIWRIENENTHAAPPARAPSRVVFRYRRMLEFYDVVANLLMRTKGCGCKLRLLVCSRSYQSSYLFLI